MEEPYELPASRRRKKILSPTRLIVGSFFLVILVGTLLLLLPFSTRDGHIQLVDALFTATSATCVTGLIVFDTYTEFTWFGQLVILLLIQVGGLGLVTLTSVFTVGLRRKVGFKSMKLVSESINTSSVSDAGKMLMMVIRLAFTFELVGALLLAFYFVPHFGPKGLWIAVFLSISSFCNAGFDVLGFLGPYCSLMPYVGNWYVLSIIMFLIVSGGLGFVVWHEIFSLPKTKHLSINAKVVLLFTGVLLALGTLGLLALEWNNPTTIGQLPADEKVLASMFQSVTARTAGYATLNLASLTMFSKYLMILLMFIGAAPGGTGGGVKVTTIGVLAVTVFCVAGGREDPVIFGRRIDKKTVYRSATVILLSLIAVLVSAVTIFFNTDARVTEVDSLFEAVSAYATVGLSTGATVLMNTPAKLITVVTMFIGRVGPVSLLISLARQASEGSRREVLPEARINVG
ncbi:MAG TPA: potassium transporter Trk [Candidatus Anaerofilum excrementigallinarum]|nr:potassium transporter Trk [Candidatus Anaerofilum excrementigallinarum]